MLTNDALNWTTCQQCQGRGKKRKKIRKKMKLRYQRALAEFERSLGNGTPPVPPRGHLDSCEHCAGSGLVSCTDAPIADTENYPHVAIIGGGIGGVALAVACLHRGIPFTLYERDTGFGARSQGYGLTLQQASKAIEALGVTSLTEGIISTRHVVHTTQGKIIGEWGARKWLASAPQKTSKRTNVHIARQSLRLALLNQLRGNEHVQWGHQLVDFTEENNEVALSFQVNDEIKTAKADLVVGADGIRSSVRKLLIGEQASPLRYLGCIVILGICSLDDIKVIDKTLLDSATVFQTANGNERIYMMPYDENSIMWQLSFPMPEHEAKALSAQGVSALKKEALSRTQWHSPIPEIVAVTPPANISGYPVYDRVLLTPELLGSAKKVTLIGDAAHPMSPFKGQGANQALLDALSLARGIYQGCRAMSQWREKGIKASVLREYEAEMLTRSAAKVKDSADAAEHLHSELVLLEGDEPRGRSLTKADT